MNATPRIGLVNAMPGDAHAHTERRFRALLAPTPLLCAGLADTAALRASRLDGLIVTGMPPATPRLQDDPAWPALARLVDHAAERAIPTLFLCLAAHAAVLHLDGIARVRLPAKLSGLFRVRAAAAHPLLAGLPASWRVPHSRHHDVAQAALEAAGYRILSGAPEVGADIFTRQCGARFVFCQGHLEYDALSLLREYRRDIAAFLAGRADRYPAMPCHCFTPATQAALAGLQAHAERTRSLALLAAFPARACAAELRDGWSDVAARFYANWLADLAPVARQTEAAWAN